MCAGVRVARSRGVGRREEERGGERERDGILFLYVDRGGCPVFRVTWLNGIALAHSCPLRRDGRLASRIFLPLPSPALPRSATPHTSPSQSRLARASLVNAREKTLFLFFFFLSVGNKRSAARNNARSNAASLQ